jgi:CHAT domain-containing protein/tetratricopeptide (TPR) repeat protein
VTGPPARPAGAEPDEVQIRAQMSAGKVDEAEAGARRLVAIRAQESGEQAPATAEAMGLLVEVLVRNDKSSQQETLDLARRAVAIQEQALGDSAPPVAEALERLGVVQRNRAEFAAAKASFERALGIEERSKGPDHPDVARALVGLAQALMSLQKGREAIPHLERALVIQKASLEDDNIDVAKTLINLGMAHRSFGQFVQARPRFEQALAILTRIQGPDGKLVGICLNNLANVERDLGEVNQAREHHERALAIMEVTFGPEHSNTASVLHSLAVELTDIGDYAAARPLRERCLRIDEKALGPEHPDVVDDLLGMADLLFAGGDLLEAETLYRKALGIVEKTQGADHVFAANAALGLGNVMRESRRFAEADALYSRTLEIWSKKYPADDPSLARIFSEVAGLRQAEGRMPEACDLDRRALSVWEGSVGPDSQYVAVLRSQLALCETSVGNQAEASALLASVLPAVRDGYGEDSLPYAWALESKAGLDALSGRSGEALKGALQARSISRKRFEEAARGLSEREALRFEATALVPLDIPLSLLAGHAGGPAAVGQVWDEVMRSRAMVLDEIASRHRDAPAAAHPPEMDARLQALARDRAALGRVTVRGPDPDHPGDYAALLREARERAEKDERELAALGWSRPDPARAAVDLQEVRRRLPHGCALLAYVRYSQTGARGEAPVESYLAFVLGAGSGSAAAVPLGPAAIIDARIASWRRELTRDPRLEGSDGEAAEERYRDRARAVREIVWDPVASRLGDASQVFIVPDGNLHFVSFAALARKEGGYLVESPVALHYLSSERDALAPVRRRTGSGLLALADPAYDGSAGGPSGTEGSKHPTYRGPRAGCASFRSMSFEGLPESRKEVEAVRSIVRSPENLLLLTGQDADEGTFKRLAPGRRVIHLATHGFFLDADCLQASDGAASSEAGVFALSGLALAGANTRNAQPLDKDVEDGILTAEEIAALDLSGVEWAVLSACDTGLGSVQSGEGILGLRRAFENAGVGTLIMTLWPVEDDATRRWMEELYRGRAAGRSAPQAVREASLSLLRSQRRLGGSTHPYYWGGFVAAGDWR